jgi:hypothetical protein
MAVRGDPLVSPYSPLPLGEGPEVRAGSSLDQKISASLLIEQNYKNRGGLFAISRPLRFSKSLWSFD